MKSSNWLLGIIGLCVIGLIVQSLRLRALTTEVAVRQARLAEESARAQAAAAASEASAAELGRLRRELEALRAEAVELRGRLTRTDRPNSRDATTSSLVTQRARSIGGQTSGQPDSVMRSYVDSRLSLARERLGLSPEQEEAMRVAVDSALQTGLENLRRLRAGEITYDDAPTLQEWSKALEDQILAGLSPEQQAAFQQHKQAEQQGNARMAANTELLLVQGSLGLSTEQQDAMFSVLYDQSLRSMDTDPQTHVGRPRDPVAALEWEASQKRQALQGVLTPAQMANYEQLQNSYRDMVGRFLRPAAPAPGAATPTPSP